MMNEIETPIPSSVPSETVSVSHLGLTLKYRLWGDHKKPLVILQHGGKDHGRSWDWTIAALADRYCLAVPDLRGHGDSDRPPGGGYEAFDFVGDFAVVVEDLIRRGFEPPFRVIGHSLGGNIALHFTAASPAHVSHLVAIEGLGLAQDRYDQLLETPVAERWNKALQKRLKVNARAPRIFTEKDEAVARMAALHPQLSAEQARHLALNALTKEGEGWTWKHDPALTFMPIRPVPPTEYNALYASIKCPTLLMYGGKSWATSPAQDGRMAPFQDAKLIVYEDAGHWLHHDQLDDFVRDVRTFLEG